MCPRRSPGARSSAFVAIASAAAVIAAGCGGGAPNAPSSSSGASTAPSAASAAPPPANLKRVEDGVKGMAFGPREQKLKQMAASEGNQVNVDTSLSDLVVGPLEQAWKAKYPDIKLKLYRASSEDVSSKVLAERDADRSGADVVETNGTNMLTFQDRKNVLIPYSGSPYAAQIPKDYRFPTFTADRVYTYLRQHGGPGGSAMPTSKLDSMWHNIAGNAQIINGHTDQANALAAGQVQVLISGHAQSLEQLAAKHAPVTFKPFVQPVVERPQGVGLVYGLSHPAAAVLFYDWLLSPDGQKVLQSNGVEAANPKFPDPNFATKPQTLHLDLPPIVDRYEQWQNKYESFTNAPATD